MAQAIPKISGLARACETDVARREGFLSLSALMRKREVVQPGNSFLPYYHYDYGREVFSGDGPLNNVTRAALVVPIRSSVVTKSRCTAESLRTMIMCRQLSGTTFRSNVCLANSSRSH